MCVKYSTFHYGLLPKVCKAKRKSDPKAAFRMCFYFDDVADEVVVFDDFLAAFDESAALPTDSLVDSKSPDLPKCSS